MRENDKLLKLIPKLSEVEFIGLARILRVPLVDEVNPSAAEPQEKYKVKEFTDVLAGILEKFEKCSRSRRREIIRILSAATRKGDDDADNS